MADSAVPAHSIPPDAEARFGAAESRLYSLAMVDAEMYERGVTLCSLVLRDLRSTCADIDAVLQRRGTLLALLPRSADEADLSLLGFQPETLVDSASALRCRELQAEQGPSTVRARIAAAREAGQEWAVDEPEPSAVMAGFYRRVERHIPTGAILVSSIEADSTGAPAAYALELIPGPTPSDPPLTERSQTFADRDSWILAAERYRSEMSSHP